MLPVFDGVIEGDTTVLVMVLSLSLRHNYQRMLQCMCCGCDVIIEGGMLQTA